MIVAGWQGWVAVTVAVACAFTFGLIFAGFALALADHLRRRQRARRRGGYVDRSRGERRVGW